MKNQARHIKEFYDLRQYLQTAHGIVPTKQGGDWWKFEHPPWRPDSDSKGFSVAKEKWYDHARDEQGDIIDMVMQMQGVDNAGAQAILLEGVPPPAERKPVKGYSYKNRHGDTVYQTVRTEPKGFFQRHKDADGAIVNDMKGVERVLYNLPQVLSSDTVVIVEGEKDADTLIECGFVATTNVGGASAWSDAYAEVLAGKKVVIIPDVDDAGKNFADTVITSLAKNAETLHLVNLPPPFGDITEYSNDYSTLEQATAAIQRLIDGAADVSAGAGLPLYTVKELEQRYLQYLKESSGRHFDLGKWLPKLGENIRPLRPGDLVTIIAGTGAGKSAAVQNIALAAAPLPTLVFSLELPEEDILERYVSIHTGVRTKDVAMDYGCGRYPLLKGTEHIITCPESRLNMEQVREFVIKSELKFGGPPAVVMIDYIGLLSRGKSSRYEAVSDAAEAAKIMAKDTRSIVFLVSQISRPPDAAAKKKAVAPGLYDGKDTGSIENSSGLVLSLHRPAGRHDEIEVLPLKCTRGFVNEIIQCTFETSTMAITEKKRINDDEIPI